MTDWERLREEITRDNALELLRDLPCLYCGNVGQYRLFDEMANYGVGLQCLHCERHHPLIKQRIMWIRGTEKRRSNDIASVMRDCGAYCYSCGRTYNEISKLGLGFAVHHTRPFVDHGEQYKKIPLCALCHEVINALQRTMRRLIATTQVPSEVEAEEEEA